MLTLQELKQVVSNREERRKVPSAKYLRENDVAVAKQRLMDSKKKDSKFDADLVLGVEEGKARFSLEFPKKKK